MLPRLAERIERLSERSLEANPFILPSFLEPALAAFGRRNLRLATVSDRDDLRFFAPVEALSPPFSFGRGFRVWTHDYAPLGSPFVDRDAAQQASDALLAHLGATGRTLFVVPDLPLHGETARSLRAAADRHGTWREAARRMRPILVPGHGDSAGGLEAMIAPKRRKELDRQLRKLGEIGAISHMAARAGFDLETAFDVFVALEASGWKGRRGSALRENSPAREFARQAVMDLARQGRAAIDVLRVGERPVAALIRFDHAGLSIPWKIAYDEEFSSLSPGKQLMSDATRRWLADGVTRRVDPVCEADNPLMNALWTGQERYGTLLLTPARLGISAGLASYGIDLRRGARAQAKQLLSWRGKRVTAKRERQPGSRTKTATG